VNLWQVTNAPIKVSPQEIIINYFEHHLQEYESRVIKPTLATFEEFQEHDSG